MYKESLFDDQKTVSLKKGKVLTKPGDKIQKIYYLIKGNVKMYARTPNGDVTIHIFKKGSYFPTMLILGKLANKYYFQAVSNVKVKVMTPEKVLKLLKNDPEVLLDLTRRLALGIEGMSSRLVENLGERVDKKLISTLTYLGKSFGKELDGKTKINIPLTHNDLASWLGVSRETISREMKKLAKSGHIYYKYKEISLLNKVN